MTMHWGMGMQSKKTHSKHGYRVLLAVLLLSVICMQTAQAGAGGVFISEYIEGSSNNKAIEIYNGTGATVDLAASSYRINMYFNGSTTATTIINLTGSVAPGDVYVVAHPSASPDILSKADQTSLSSSWYNGNDAVVLLQGAAVVDSIGRVGEDPGLYWGDTVTNTLDHTLVRKPSVSAGDTDPSDAFDPSAEWTAYPQNTTIYLGSHQIAAVHPAVIPQTGDETHATAYLSLSVAAAILLTALYMRYSKRLRLLRHGGSMPE